MYNSYIKADFIENHYNEAQKDVEYTFNRISKLEEERNKDIAEFSKDQLVKALISMRAPTINALAKIKTTIKQYTTWASDHDIFPPNDCINQIQRQELVRYLDSDAVVNGYIKSRDELYDICNELANPVDQAILILLFEGLNGDDMLEIRMLKKEDINFKDRLIIVSGESNRTIRNVDVRSLDILKRAIEKDDYDNKNGHSKAKAPKRYMINSSYVIRPTKMHNIDGDPISYAGINIKFRNIKKGTGRVHFTATNIFYSGVFNKLDSLGELSIEVFKSVLRDYGMNQNIYAQLRERYAAFKFYKSDVHSLMSSVSMEFGLRQVTLKEIAKYSSNSENDEPSGTHVHDPDKKERLKEHQELVHKFASMLNENAYKLYERPVDCLGIKNNCTSILCEVKTLDGTFSDEVEQVRRCLSQLLYYKLLKINEVTDSNLTQNVALFSRKIKNNDHIIYLQSFDCIVLWYEDGVLNGTNEALSLLKKSIVLK